MTRELTLPVSQDDVKALRVGDMICLTGLIFTARDEAHHVMLQHHSEGKELAFDPSQMALFHCGPVMQDNGGVWRVVSAGPTTSMRMDVFEDQFLATFGTKILIGKGGMGDRTQKALEEHGAVYTHYTGGAGALASKAFERVEAVYWLEELGMPEAVWILKANCFGPLLVTMDSAGGNLYKEVEQTVSRNKKRIDERISA